MKNWDLITGIYNNMTGKQYKSFRKPIGSGFELRRKTVERQMGETGTVQEEYQRMCSIMTFTTTKTS
jgi:hypothetical protein